MKMFESQQKMPRIVADSSKTPNNLLFSFFRYRLSSVVRDPCVTSLCVTASEVGLGPVFAGTHRVSWQSELEEPCTEQEMYRVFPC